LLISAGCFPAEVIALLPAATTNHSVTEQPHHLQAVTLKR
jgi:hypothetical protein